MTPNEEYMAEMDRIKAERKRLDAEESVARQRWRDAKARCQHVWVDQSYVGLLKVCSLCGTYG
jgi:hypothetical protein